VGQTPGAHTLRFLKSPPASAPPPPTQTQINRKPLLSFR
jgi:hypothetical protein